jgi:HK97 family phage major capsid protein
MNLRELKEKRQALIDENQLLLDAATEADNLNGSLTDAEASEFDTRTEAIEALNKNISRMEKMEEYKESQKQARAVGIQQDNHSEKKEIQKFRFVKYIREASEGRLTGFNAEMHQEAEKESREIGTSLSGYGIPAIALRVSRTEQEKRDSTAGTAGEGGNTIATELESSWISGLRNKIALVDAGAVFMTDLVGNVAIPRQTALPSFTWSTENATATETNVTWDQVTLSPNRLNGFIDISKQLLRQSSLDIERIIVDELTSGAARAFDDAGINGTGASNQPTGILALAGTYAVVMGTNGLAPTWATTVEYETGVAAANALMGNPSYVTNAKVRGKMKNVEKASNTGLFLWDDRNANTPINGYKTVISNAVPSTLTKGSSSGVCSAMVFGNWSDMMMATWGGLDLLINPYTKGKEALVEVIVNMYADIAYRHAESFAVCEDILTA